MRSDRQYLQDIVARIDNVTEFCAGRTPLDLESDKLLRGAVLYELTIIGEAIRQLSRGFKNKHPEIGWRRFAEFRNETIHEYFSYETDVIWDTVNTVLPPFRAQIAELLRTEFPG